MKGALLLLLLLAVPAHAQVLAVEIGRVGEVDPVDPDAAVAPPMGDNLVGSSPQRPARFTRSGPDIDARFCKRFGFEFRAPNLTPPLSVPVTVQLDHPMWTRSDGRTGTREQYANVLTSDWSYSGYGLEEDWTMEPGTWRFTILFGETVLATQSFELTVEPGQNFPAGGCAAPVS